jgi:hypothetical protein
MKVKARMKVNKFVMAAIVIIVPALAGCFGSKPFQPPPDEFEMWNKPGVGPAFIKRYLLECGYPSPINAGKYEFSINNYVLGNLCMERLGFCYKSDVPWRSICKSKNGMDAPACSGSATVSTHDRQGRVSSPFCKDFPGADVCRD